MIEVQDFIAFKKFGTELRRGWPPADSSWQCYYMLGTTTINYCQCYFKFWGCTITLERNILRLIGVIVTEINIKKVQKQDFKNIKNVKGSRDGMPKSMQTR